MGKFKSQYKVNIFIIFNNIIIIYICVWEYIIIYFRGDVMSDRVIKINRKGEDGYKVISVRIKDGILEKIDDLAQ